jgi:hypothetical protein
MIFDFVFIFNYTLLLCIISLGFHLMQLLSLLIWPVDFLFPVHFLFFVQYLQDGQLLSSPLLFLIKIFFIELIQILYFFNIKIKIFINLLPTTLLCIMEILDVENNDIIISQHKPKIK